MGVVEKSTLQTTSGLVGILATGTAFGQGTDDINSAPKISI